jgi:hypothetical protein
MSGRSKNPLWKPDGSGTSATSPHADTTYQSSLMPEIIRKASGSGSQPSGTPSGAHRSNRRPARSFSDLLARLYQQFDDLADEIATSNETPIKRAEALKSLAKTLPLLKAAEVSASVKLKDKPIEDMTVEELDRYIALNDKGGGTSDVEPGTLPPDASATRFPFLEGKKAATATSRAKNAKSKNKNKNSEPMGDVGEFPISVDEEEPK